MNIVLILLNTVIPIIFVAKKCFNSEGVMVNHVLLFTIGFYYYWIFPFLIGECFQKITLVSWHSLYNSLSSSTVSFYLLYTFLVYIVFVLVHRIPIKKTKGTEYLHSKGVYFSWILISTFLFLFMAFRNRSYLFKGYTINTGDQSFVGTMSALLLVVFSFYTLYSLKQKSGKFIKDFNNKYMLFYIICAVILVGFGGRLYIVSTLLALFVIYTSFYKRIKLGKGVIYSVIAFVIVGAIGLWRIGADITFDGILSIVASESLFTSYPLIYYLKNYKMAMLNVPIPLLSNFIYLVPTALFPEKSNYIIELSDVGYTVYAPFGALNSFMSFNVNFGLIGTILFLFFLVIIMRKLAISADNSVWKLVYGCISAHLTFTFFRDPFQVSLVKNIFEFSFLIPVIVVVLNSAITNKGKIKIRRYRRKT